MKLLSYIFILTVIFSNTACSAANLTVSGGSNSAPQNSGNNAPATESNTVNSSQNAEAAGQSQQGAPEALVKDLYKTHEKNQGKILDGKSRTLLDKYFDKKLAGLLWKDLTSHKDEVGVLDFDPFYNTQDPDIKKLNVGAAKIEGTHATVVVTFENFGQKQTVTYSLSQGTGGWKISNISYGAGENLLKYFADDAKNSSAGSKN